MRTVMGAGQLLRTRHPLEFFLTNAHLPWQTIVCISLSSSGLGLRPAILHTQCCILFCELASQDCPHHHHSQASVQTLLELGLW